MRASQLLPSGPRRPLVRARVRYAVPATVLGLTAILIPAVAAATPAAASAGPSAAARAAAADRILAPAWPATAPGVPAVTPSRAARVATGQRGAPAVPTAAAQLRWVVSASRRVPVPTAEIKAHVAAAALAIVGGPAAINQALAAAGPLTLRRFLLRQLSAAQAIAGGAGGDTVVEVQTDSTGLIDGLRFGPYQPSPSSWAQLDDAARGLAPEVSYAAMTINPRGACHLVNGVNATSSRPLGSAFKLYVLGALGRAVASGRASWDEQLAIHQAWKSLPSGVLQTVPAGTELPLASYADYMISISDNTAADHLIHFLGRGAVAGQLARFGSTSAARDIPFLTTREFFALKAGDYPARADSYLALTPAERAADLPALDRVPLSSLSGWDQPRKINQLEWFGSPSDICRAYAGLWRQNSRPGLAPIGQALSLNDGGIGLDRSAFPLVWYKGGSEPGVLTLNYLARAANGELIVSSLMLADHSAPFNETAAATEALAIVRGGVELAGQQPHPAG